MILLNQSQVLISQKCLHGNLTLVALITQQSPKEESSDAGGVRVNGGRGLGSGLGVEDRREAFRRWSARRRLEVEQSRRRNQRVRPISPAHAARDERFVGAENTTAKKSAKILGETKELYLRSKGARPEVL
jgi:hypothetical protein